MTRKYWTLPEIARFRAEYPFASMSNLMRAFGRSKAAIKCMAVKLRLEKATENAGCFKPGQKSWNAGKHYQPGGRAAETQFKKGGPHPRQRPIGTERRDRDGVYVKVAGRRHWVRKERFLWEQEHGPVPTGMVVRSGRLISRAENARLNARIRKPKARKAAPWIAPIVVLAERRA